MYSHALDDHCDCIRVVTLRAPAAARAGARGEVELLESHEALRRQREAPSCCLVALAVAVLQVQHCLRQLCARRSRVGTTHGLQAAQARARPFHSPRAGVPSCLHASPQPSALVIPIHVRDSLKTHPHHRTESTSQQASERSEVHLPPLCGTYARPLAASPGRRTRATFTDLSAALPSCFRWSCALNAPRAPRLNRSVLASSRWCCG